MPNYLSGTSVSGASGGYLNNGYGYASSSGSYSGQSSGSSGHGGHGGHGCRR